MSHPHLNPVTSDLPCPVCAREKFCMISERGDIVLCTKFEKGSYA
jgi:hypothetical protein